MMTFGDALNLMMNEGRFVRRDFWTDGIKVGVSGPQAEMTRPFVFMIDRHGEWFPWMPNQWDALARDWDVTDPPG